MTHYRAQWREAVEAAILADARFRDILPVRPWNQNLSAEELPAFNVATEREEVSQLTKVTVRRITTLTVRVWRADNDRLDETLDDDAAAIEPIVLNALRPVCWEANFTGAESMFEGQTRIGMLAMTFQIIRDTPEGDPLTAD